MKITLETNASNPNDLGALIRKVAGAVEMGCYPDAVLTNQGFNDEKEMTIKIERD